MAVSTNWSNKMIGFKNPLLVEGLEVYFTGRKILGIYFNFLLILSVILFITWPKTEYFEYLLTGSSPQTYSIIAIAALVIISYLSFRFGADEIKDRDTYHLSDWLILTPLSSWRILSGRLTLFVLHTAFLVLISAPFIVIPGTISGISPPEMLWGFLIVFLSALTYRTIGFFCLLVLDDREFLLHTILRIIFVFFMVVVIFPLPPASPILSLVSVSSLLSDRYNYSNMFGQSYIFYKVTLVIHTAILTAMVGTLIIWLRSYRKRLRRVKDIQTLI